MVGPPINKEEKTTDQRLTLSQVGLTECYPPPPSLRALPSVALGSATLRGYRMTSSHSSKDSLRPPVSEGQSVTTANAITHFLPLRQGGVPRRGGWMETENVLAEFDERRRIKVKNGKTAL